MFFRGEDRAVMTTLLFCISSDAITELRKQPPQKEEDVTTSSQASELQAAFGIIMIDGVREKCVATEIGVGRLKVGRNFITNEH